MPNQDLYDMINSLVEEANEGENSTDERQLNDREKRCLDRATAVIDQINQIASDATKRAAGEFSAADMYNQFMTILQPYVGGMNGRTSLAALSALADTIAEPTKRDMDALTTSWGMLELAPRGSITGSFRDATYVEQICKALCWLMAARVMMARAASSGFENVRARIEGGE